MHSDGGDSATGTSRFSASAALGGAEWPARAADAVEGVVDALHDGVIRPLVLAARGIVFGIVIGAMTMVLGTLGSIAAVRLLDSYRYPFGRRVWAAETAVGGLLTLLGLLAWSQRRSRRSPES